MVDETAAYSPHANQKSLAETPCWGKKLSTYEIEAARNTHQYIMRWRTCPAPAPRAARRALRLQPRAGRTVGGACCRSPCRELSPALCSACGSCMPPLPSARDTGGGKDQCRVTRLASARYHKHGPAHVSAPRMGLPAQVSGETSDALQHTASYGLSPHWSLPVNTDVEAATVIRVAVVRANHCCGTSRTSRPTASRAS